MAVGTIGEVHRTTDGHVPLSRNAGLLRTMSIPSPLTSEHPEAGWPNSQPVEGCPLDLVTRMVLASHCKRCPYSGHDVDYLAVG